jgi:multidrug resistance efflux pump
LDAAAPAPVAATTDRQRWQSGLVFGAIAVIGILIVLYAWRLPPFGNAVVSTENALVRGEVTIIGTQLSGYVEQVKVQDFQTVHRGDVLALIDVRTYADRRAQAAAQLAGQEALLTNWTQQRHSAEQSILLAQSALAFAEAQGHKTNADLGRVNQLVGDGSLSVREQDQVTALQAQSAASLGQARAALEIARQNLQSVLVARGVLAANVDNARAALRAAANDVDKTRIVAPVDGQLGQVGVRRGAFVNAGAQLMGLVPRQLWIIANFKETQMNAVRVGQRAWFTVDALDGARLAGQVELLAPATGSEFSVLQPDNATGNFVKIAQRIPVRIRIAPGQAAAQRLAPGMSVVVSIDTAAPREMRP